MKQSRVARFFDPASIAIVGASDKGMYPAGILQNLQRYGYAGRLYPVNPRREELFWPALLPRLAALPEVPDLVLVIVPRRAVLAVIDEADRLGVPAAVIITAGFAESDAEGRALEERLRAHLQQSNMAVIGPNCAGFASLGNAVIATRLPAPPQAGSVGFVSASGALMMAMQGIFADAGIGLSRLVSLGNQAGITLTDVIEALIDDPETRVIGAFVEGIDDGRRFARAAARARQAGKPLVLLKSGRTLAGQAAAATHTAALATSDRIFESVCRQTGVIRVEDIGALTETLHACATWQGFRFGRRVALITQSGGMGSLAADWASQCGLTLPPLPAGLQEALLALPALKDVPALGNPADVRGAAALGESAAEVVSRVLGAPEFDAVVLLLAKSAVAERELATARALAAVAQSLRKPFAIVWAGQRAPRSEGDSREPLRLLQEAGFPIFAQPGDCLRLIARLAAWHETRVPPLPAVDPAYCAPRACARAVSRRLLEYAEVERLLGAYGISLIAAEQAADADGAAVAALRLGLPVALKGLSARHSHKSEAGLVRVGLGTAAAVRAVAAGWLADPALAVDGLLVQKMAPPGMEVWLGVENDAQFGPLLAAGPGGVLVEVLNQSTLRMAPVTPQDAAAMLSETALARLLAGVRGAPPANVDTLCELMVRLSQLAAQEAATLLSLDMNPVIVHARGLSIVDARIEVGADANTNQLRG